MELGALKKLIRLVSRTNFFPDFVPSSILLILFRLPDNILWKGDLLDLVSDFQEEETTAVLHVEQ